MPPKSKLSTQLFGKQLASLAPSRLPSPTAGREQQTPSAVESSARATFCTAAGHQWGCGSQLLPALTLGCVLAAEAVIHQVAPFPVFPGLLHQAVNTLGILICPQGPPGWAARWHPAADGPAPSAGCCGQLCCQPRCPKEHQAGANLPWVWPGPISTADFLPAHHCESTQLHGVQLCALLGSLFNKHGK